MKKLFLTFLFSILTISQNINATPADSSDINMVSYEQSWLDNMGTIYLKNNTSEDIYNVSFVLEYLDMEDNPMHYETFSYNIDIAPGMTKKLDIPAYEPNRRYHYYKTKDQFGNPAFKLRYILKDYNSKVNKTTNNLSSPHIEHSNDINISFILIFLFILGIYVGMYVLVAVMAQRRNRNPAIWLLLSFIATPLLICIILFAIGSANNNEFR